MSVAFYRGQQLGPEDLNIYLEDTSGHPTNAAEITYALYDFTTGQEVLLGAPRRAPVNASVGAYYASFIVPLDALIGAYRVRWTFRERIGGAIHQVLQEFAVIDKVTSSLSTASYTDAATDLARRLRILLRDSSPDRNYHFRPPAHEETIGQFNQVFGAIWEDSELQEYLERSLDRVIAAPPRTPFPDIDSLVRDRPEWRTLLLNGAMMDALFAVMLNWISDEFSLEGSSMVQVFIPRGRSRDQKIVLSIEELFSQVRSDSAIGRAYRAGELRTLSVSRQGELELCMVADVMQHSTGHKAAMCIEVEGGAKVVTTEDHSLFSAVNEPVRSDCLSEGSGIVVVTGGCVGLASVVKAASVAPLDVSYDLSVPGPENFVLTNGIVAHNSYSIGGVSLDIEKSSKYESAYNAMKEAFSDQLEKAKLTVKLVKGLQQPKYGIGIRSSFGPYTGRGTLTPRRFVG
jgi:hypothetical protein